MITKFTSGAWVVLVAVPCLMVLFVRINRYYGLVRQKLGARSWAPGSCRRRRTAARPTSWCP